MSSVNIILGEGGWCDLYARRNPFKLRSILISVTAKASCEESVSQEWKENSIFRRRFRVNLTLPLALRRYSETKRGKYLFRKIDFYLI